MRLTRNETILLGASLAAAMGSLYCTYRYFTEAQDDPTTPPPPRVKPAVAEKVQPEPGLFVPQESRPRMGRPEGGAAPKDQNRLPGALE